jgi:uncharacterized membrane protein
MATPRHPLHPAMVHFPVACWSLATLADLASLWLGQPAWWLAGVLLAIGTLLALAAMATGLLEFVRIEAGSPALRDASRHMMLAMAAWILYAASLFLRLHGSVLIAPAWLALATSLAGFLCLVATGWMGGRLVYTHRLGGVHPPP